MPRTMRLICLSLLFWPVLSSAQQGVPEEALRHMARGEAAVESAKSSGDFKSAIAEFEQAGALAPTWPNPFFNLGVVQETAGDFDGAIANLRRYLALAPEASDAADVKTRIYKLEYKKERSNIVGMWYVDQDESTNECAQGGLLFSTQQISSTGMPIMNLHLDIQATASEPQVRFLGGPRGFGTLPDGAFVPIQREGDILKIFSLPMYACLASVRADSCEWSAKLVLKHSAANVMEGTIEVTGLYERVTSFRDLSHTTTDVRCSGKLVLRRVIR